MADVALATTTETEPRWRVVWRNAFPFLVVGAIWEIVARAGVFPPRLFPSLETIAATFWRLTLAGILPHHAALLTELMVGELRIKRGGVEDHFAIGGGFMEVRHDRVTVLAQTAAPDAAAYGDEGADTVGHIAERCAAGEIDCSDREGPLHLPNLVSLGLGAACELATDWQRIEQWGMAVEAWITSHEHVAVFGFCAACCAEMFIASGNWD